MLSYSMELLFSKDDHQDIARSSYADMLNDDERNKAYDSAINITVRSLVTSKEHNPNGDRYFRCGDIGAGSGLLSMMIVRAFKNLNYSNFNVIAFECFQPMAQCAQNVIMTNGMSEHVTVMPTKSIQVIEDFEPFDLLVAELLDTELIGEGCIQTYRHAINHLCSPTCLFIPHQARIYAEPIASTILFQRHAIDHLKFGLGDGCRVNIKVPTEVRDCCGLAEMDDLQLSALREGQHFVRICEPQVAFHFTFNNLESLKFEDHRELIFQVLHDIEQPVVVAMWWDIVMYDKVLTSNADLDASASLDLNMEVLSCAPNWARDERQLDRDRKIANLYGRDVWREHWIQAIYYFSDVVATRTMVSSMKAGDLLKVHAYHDTHSLWFDLSPTESRLPLSCECGVHRGFSRAQLAFLSDESNMSKLIRATIGYLPKNEILEGSVAFMKRPIFEEKIDIDRAPKWKLHLGRDYKLLDLSFNDEFQFEKVLARFLDHMPIDPIETFVIKFTQVKLDNLNRIRTNIGTCEGFDLSDLDEMIVRSSMVVDQALEPHHLSEYGTTRLDSDHILCSSSMLMTDGIPKVMEGTWKRNYKLLVQHDCPNWRRGWALVFWAEFTLKNTREIISLGPVGNCSNEEGSSAPAIGQRIEWNRNCKQLVYFMHDYYFKTRGKREISIDILLKKYYIDIQWPTVDDDSLNTSGENVCPTKLPRLWPDREAQTRDLTPKEPLRDREALNAKQAKSSEKERPDRPVKQEQQQTYDNDVPSARSVASTSSSARVTPSASPSARLALSRPSSESQPSVKKETDASDDDANNQQNLEASNNANLNNDSCLYESVGDMIVRRGGR